MGKNKIDLSTTLQLSQNLLPPQSKIPNRKSNLQVFVLKHLYFAFITTKATQAGLQNRNNEKSITIILQQTKSRLKAILVTQHFLIQDNNLSSC